MIAVACVYVCWVGQFPTHQTSTTKAEHRSARGVHYLVERTKTLKLRERDGGPDQSAIDCTGLLECGPSGWASGRQATTRSKVGKQGDRIHTGRRRLPTIAMRWTDGDPATDRPENYRRGGAHSATHHCLITLMYMYMYMYICTHVDLHVGT